MQKVIPALRMLDYEESKAFYLDKLGFAADWEHQFEPNFPVFMQISRDGMSLFLTSHTGDCEPGSLVHLIVPDMDAWLGELKGKGVSIEEEPHEVMEGVMSMTVCDPAGNQIRFLTYLDD